MAAVEGAEGEVRAKCKGEWRRRGEGVFSIQYSDGVRRTGNRTLNTAGLEFGPAVRQIRAVMQMLFLIVCLTVSLALPGWGEDAKGEPAGGSKKEGAAKDEPGKAGKENPVKNDYQKKVKPLVAARWLPAVRAAGADTVKAGQTNIGIVVDEKGKLISTRVISNTSNEAHAKICEKAVQDAAKGFPAVPAELLDPKTKTYEFDLNFAVY